MSEHPAVPVVRRFVDAVLWGEHLRVWELLSAVGKEHVLAAGARRGLDAVKAARIRQGTSPAAEMDTFLTGLLHGLRVDFSAVELSAVQVAGSPEVLGPGMVRLGLETPAAFGEQPWAAGALTLSQVSDQWLIDRIEPLVSRL